VSTDSAAGGCSDTHIVESDHFSYLQNTQALAAVDRVIADAEAERERAPAREASA
jgi:hypothetical protein